MNLKQNNLPFVDEAVVDVSHGLGIPFGGIGTGYAVFGKYGFVNVNFNSTPDLEQIRNNTSWEYTKQPLQSPEFALVLAEGTEKLLLQETQLPWLPGVQPVKSVKAYAMLPKGYFRFEPPDAWNIILQASAFAPLIPYDLDQSSIPVQVFDVEISNQSGRVRGFELTLTYAESLQTEGDIAVFNDHGVANGQIAFAIDGGAANERGVTVSFQLNPSDAKRFRCYIAWYYPAFKTPSPHATDTYQRYYTKNFTDVIGVIHTAIQAAEGWSAAIDAWHDAYDVPLYFKRLWFSSLSSIICSTMLSSDPYFFEIETPHPWINTMDVTVYSSWLYLIHWPELERMDMEQYFKAMPTTGPDTGFVWHSLWNEGADYMEEPLFPARIYRDYLWFGDREWLVKAFEYLVLACKRAYRNDTYQYLLVSDHGNQSYDMWKMPGINAYVNNAWIHSLYALSRISEILGRPIAVAGMPVGELLPKAVRSFDGLLWNEAGQYWNCFYRTPHASQANVAEASFLDQLIGKWVLAIDRDLPELLPAEKVRQALQSLYRNNLVYDPENGFRGWANGMLPDGKPDLESGYHSRTCWLGAQLNLGSLLGECGEETAALDVFQSLESSLRDHHLAVGEWNQSVTANRKSGTLPEEPSKDTPRFPPYPRYKCCWEYLVRILGFKLNERYILLQPFKTINFKLKEIRLGGVTLTVNVMSEWTKVFVDGKESDLPLQLDRSHGKYVVEFNTV